MGLTSPPPIWAMSPNTPPSFSDVTPKSLNKQRYFLSIFSFSFSFVILSFSVFGSSFCLSTWSISWTPPCTGWGGRSACTWGGWDCCLYTSEYHNHSPTLPLCRLCDWDTSQDWNERERHS